MALDFLVRPLGLAALRLAVNLARLTMTRVCLSCFGSTNSGHAAFHQDPDLFKLLRLCKFSILGRPSQCYVLCLLFASPFILSFSSSGCTSSAMYAGPRAVTGRLPFDAPEFDLTALASVPSSRPQFGICCCR